MKAIIFFILSVTIFNSQACEKTTEHFVLIHGIAGLDSHFGSLEKTLEAKIKCAQAHHFSYKTSNSSLSVTDFANEVGEFIKSLPKGTKKKDLNLIGHSQGGLISLEWILLNYENDPVVKRLNRYITLSTPFWGSDFANLGNAILYPFGAQRNLISPAGRVQLVDMKYGSFKSFVTLNRLIKARSFISENIQVLNIAAMAPFSLNWLENRESNLFEGDLIVNIPSMKLDSIFAIDHSFNYDEDEIIKSKIMKTNIAKEVHTRGMHIDFILGDGEDFHGVADTPKSCIKSEVCSNPSIDALLKFVKGETPKGNIEISNSVKSFELKVHVQVPFGYETDDITVSVLNETDQIKIREAVFGDESEPISKDIGGGTVMLRGSIMQKNKDIDLILEIKHPYLKTKKVSVRISKGLTTFLNTGLAE